jgi:DNA replication protein DnaD
MAERDFKGVWIPRAVWLDESLNALEKVILTEIDSLDMGESGCFASNKYIADFCQCSETKVSTAISKLIDRGYLYVKSFDGRQRVLKSRLSNFERQTLKNCEAESQNLKHNNTYSNTDNKTSIKEIGEKRKRFSPPTLEDVRAYCQERHNDVDAQRFIDYYTSNGWQVGKNKMRDWKAAVRTWERNKYYEKKSVGANGIPISNAPSELDGLF